MLRYLIVGLSVLLSSSALAQSKAPRQILSVPKQNIPVRPELVIKDAPPPADSGAHWKLHPVTVGGFGYTNMALPLPAATRRLYISIFNPSTLRIANVKVDCGRDVHLGDRSGAKLPAAEATEVGAADVNMSAYSFKQFRVGAGTLSRVAICDIQSNKPVVVAAWVEERAVDFECAGETICRYYPINTSIWPAFRLDSAK